MTSEANAAGNQKASASQNPRVRFCDLDIGEQFEFAVKTDVGCGKYNAVFIKTMPGAYRGECFTGYPQTGVEVLRVPSAPAAKPSHTPEETILKLRGTINDLLSQRYELLAALKFIATTELTGEEARRHADAAIAKVEGSAQ